MSGTVLTTEHIKAALRMIEEFDDAVDTPIILTEREAAILGVDRSYPGVLIVPNYRPLPIDLKDEHS